MRTDHARLRRLPAAVALGLLFGLGNPYAADDRAAPKAETAARPSARTASPDPDSMDLLREKLAEKLGATRPAVPGGAAVVRLVAKTEPTLATAAPVLRAKPDAAALAAAHRAEKGAAGGVGSHDLHWSYHGTGGPENWGSLKPEFAKCAAGSRQSPIDIRGGIAVDLEPIKFDYRPSGFSVLDNGHSVQVNVGAGNAIEVMGRRYDLVQFHFHRPSEERIDGRQYDMDAHLVHRDADGRLAVVAVLFDRGAAQPQVQTVWNNLPLEKGEELAAGAPLDPLALLPQDRRYFTYMGSLTTPPCTEGVLWMVLKQPVPVSAEQIGVFSRLYPMNARPIQQASGRLIKQSN